MAVEVANYRLTYRGKPAGTQVLKTELQGRHTQLEGRSQFQGPLGTATTVQRSRSHAQRHYSLRYLEQTQERNEQRTFDVTFDARTGLVSAAKGPKDQATIPYLVPYRDPLGLLHEIRSLEEPTEPRAVPMLGKDVNVQFAGVVELETALGKKQARAYLLQPGHSIVYVDAEAPHHILKLTQRLAEGHLDALIVSIGTEPALEPFSAQEAPTKSRRGGRRGGRAGAQAGGQAAARNKGDQPTRRRPRRRRRS